jgi:uncharacterized protein involved in outer membrane biogenesis
MKKRYSIPQWILLGIVVALVALHFALPLLVRNYLNDKLADMGDYRGHIADVDLAWWRGAYGINDLSIVKVDGKVPLPFVEAPHIDLSVSWKALWYERAVVAEVVFEQPVVNFVDGGKNQQNSQTGQGTNWQDQLKKLLPITLNEVQVVDGVVSFHNFTSTPPVDLRATQVNASIYNLTNVSDEQGARVARFEGTAKLLDHAPLESSATFDPLQDFEEFQLKLRVTDIDLTRLNDFSSAYGKFDFKAGSGDLVIEASADNGELSGYIKPLLHNVEVFDWQQDVANGDKGLFRSIWEALVGVGETALKNQPKDQFATRVELSGNVHRQDVSAFQAFLAILRNAFVEAFTTQFENAPDRGEPVEE